MLGSLGGLLKVPQHVYILPRCLRIDTDNQAGNQEQSLTIRTSHKKSRRYSFPSQLSKCELSTNSTSFQFFSSVKHIVNYHLLFHFGDLYSGIDVNLGFRLIPPFFESKLTNEWIPQRDPGTLSLSLRNKFTIYDLRIYRERRGLGGNFPFYVLYTSKAFKSRIFISLI